MENNNYSNFYSALGAYRILLITFIILKLTDNIDWSWWWVTSPLWIPLVIVTLMTLLFELSDLQMRKIINHIWKYFTNPDYRLKVYLKRLNKKKQR